MRAAPLLALLIAVFSTPDLVAAQSPLRASEEQLVNYAYATQLGSGVYDISGRTLQIYRLPFAYTVTEPTGRRPGVRLTLPVTIGFIDFKPRDVLDTGLPDNLDTLSFEPGVELDFELTPHWHVLPFLQAGHSWELGGGGDATLYSFGAHLEGLKTWNALDLRFDVGAIYAAVNPSGPVHSDDLIVLELGFEARHALGLNLRRTSARLGRLPAQPDLCGSSRRAGRQRTGDSQPQSVRGRADGRAAIKDDRVANPRAAPRGWLSLRRRSRSVALRDRCAVLRLDATNTNRGGSPTRTSRFRS